MIGTIHARIPYEAQQMDIDCNGLKPCPLCSARLIPFGSRIRNNEVEEIFKHLNNRCCLSELVFDANRWNTRRSRTSTPKDFGFTQQEMKDIQDAQRANSTSWFVEYNKAMGKKLNQNFPSPRLIAELDSTRSKLKESIELCEELLLYCEGWAKDKWEFEKQVTELKNCVV